MSTPTSGEVVAEASAREAEQHSSRAEEPTVDATREQLDEARGWIADCVWREEPEDLDELTDAQVVAGVERHYVGGWSGLVRAAGLDERERE